MTLQEVLRNLKPNQAILHFNFATFEQFKAGVEAVLETGIPLIFGVSEGERDYVREENAINWLAPYRSKLLIFLNADHTKNLDKAKKAIDLNYDAVLFDGSELSFEDNINKTKEIVEYRNKHRVVTNKEILIEGELGYLPGKSDLEREIEVKEEYLTKPEEAEKFVQETKADLLAISVGNVHGMPLSVYRVNGPNQSALSQHQSASLDFERIRQIKERVKIPLVLHGGSGLTNADFKQAIQAGISIIHLNTEFRKIWKDELIKEVNSQKTVVPYKILEPVVKKLKERIIYYQKLFWRS